MGIVSSTICTCTFFVPVPGSLMRLARIGPAKFLPQMASKPSTVHESWSLKVRPDHVLRSSHAEAQGKMNNKTALYELYALGLCPLPLALRLNHWFNEKSRPFNWEASEASSWPIISVIIHLRHANLRKNTRRNYQIHSCHHYQKGCIFDG